MQIKEDIHWHEGLFLQQHHLQQMQQAIVSHRMADRQLMLSYSYGLIEAELSQDNLQNHIIQFTHLRAVMPSGRIIDTKGNAAIPALNIRKPMEEVRGPLMIYLALPVASDSEANAIDMGAEENEQRIKRPYRVVERQHFDENTGDNEQPVLHRRFNASLTYEGEDHGYLELMPILRVQPSGIDEEDGPPLVDTRYIPPAIVMSGSRQLTDMVSELLSQMLSRRHDIVMILNRSGYVAETLQGVQLDHVLQLQAVNRCCGLLENLIIAPSTTPFEIYLLLRATLGELAALEPGRDLYDVIKYDHDDPYAGFHDLILRIRNLLIPERSGTYAKIAFEAEEQGTWSAELTDEYLINAEEYYLAVTSRDNPNEVVSLVEDGDQFKMIAESQKRSRVRGVGLEEERYPPAILPAKNQVFWFKLKRSDSKHGWARIRDEKKIAIVCPPAAEMGFEMALYVTLFSERGES